MMEKAEVPSGWVYATIRDVVASDGVFTDGDWVETKDQDPNGGVRLIQLADLGDGSFLDKSSRFLTRAKAYELNCTFLAKGDLLVARMPDPLGRCCIFPLDGVEKYVTVVDVCAVRLGTSPITPKYMMYLINSPRTRANIEALKSGSTRKRISRGNFASVEIPLAPQNEQNRIIAKIQELFSELDKGVESLKTARGQLNVYLPGASLLAGSSSVRVSIPKSIVTTRRRSVVEAVETDARVRARAAARSTAEKRSPSCSSSRGGEQRSQQHDSDHRDERNRTRTNTRSGINN